MIKIPALAPLEGRMNRYVLPGLLTLLVPYISKLVYLAFFSPAARIPGPFLARFTRLWELKALNRGDFEKKNVELHEKYGTRWQPERDPIQSRPSFRSENAPSRL